MKRTIYLDQITRHLRVQPICAVLGPKHIGKNTLARQFAQTYSQKVEFFDLENPI
jgi:predicted AAA+ superfamily ATPase